MHIQLLGDDDPVGLLRNADVEKLLREAHISDFKLSAEQVLHVDKGVVVVRCNEDVVHEHSNQHFEGEISADVNIVVQLTPSETDRHNEVVEMDIHSNYGEIASDHTKT
jgi:hypothetical protein